MAEDSIQTVKKLAELYSQSESETFHTIEKTACRILGFAGIDIGGIRLQGKLTLPLLEWLFQPDICPNTHSVMR